VKTYTGNGARRPAPTPLYTRLYNLGTEDVRVGFGDRVCQLIIQPYAQPQIVQTADVGGDFPTHRGTDGLGSTGI
jgi:dUTPase